ncbi:MAG: hypothetical protein LPK47_02680 [Bacteroidota bacterium]|nr:hypothetical protein [Bacteroidota bacterium]
MAAMSDSEYYQALDSLKATQPGHPLLRVFMMGPTTYNKGRILQELEKIHPTPSSKPLSASTSTPSEKKPMGRKPRDFYHRDLHPAYDRQLELYNLVNHLHPQLELIWKYNHGECRDSVKTLIQAWDEIDAIYRLLDYWEENKVVLPNKYQPSFSPEITDRAQLIHRRNNLRSYISKNKKKPSKAEKVKKWREELQTIHTRLALEKDH